MHFQPGVGPCRGLFCDCENFADGSFAALTLTLIHAAYLSGGWVLCRARHLCLYHDILHTASLRLRMEVRPFCNGRDFGIYWETV